MNGSEFEAIFNQQVKYCENLLVNKARMYAPDDDRLHNFQVAAKLQNTSMESALGGMLAKHLVSIFDMIADSDVHDFDKTEWDEKITDAMNYLFLLQAILYERRSAQEEGMTKAPDYDDIQN